MAQVENGAALLEVARSFRPRILEERDRIEAARRLPEDFRASWPTPGFSASFFPRLMAGWI